MQILKPHEKDLGEFSVRRVLPAATQHMVGPWIFFDHMGPVTFAPGQGVDVRPHPHINLATVTYLFEGEIFHRDSLGYAQAIQPGDINLMVAGKGIVHSEREREAVRDSAHPLHGLQLWHALPEAFEEVEPAFYHYPQNQMPSVDVNGVSVRVLMGEAYGQISPVKTFCHTVYIEASLAQNQTLNLPKADCLGIYVVSGALQVGESEVTTHQMAVIDANEVVSVNAIDSARIAIIGGEIFSKRYIEWNFVSSKKARIEKAKADWQAGFFDKVPGDEDEFIPLP